MAKEKKLKILPFLFISYSYSFYVCICMSDKYDSCAQPFIVNNKRHIHLCYSMTSG